MIVDRFEDYGKCLERAMKFVHDAEGINLHGRKYKPVPVRVEGFRIGFGCYGRILIPEITETEFTFKRGENEEKHKRIRVKATVELVTSGGWSVIAEGHAEEVRGAGNVNIKSALENCETSAIGRALANLGLIGGEYASANEMEFESLVSAKVAEIRAILNLDIEDERRAQMLYDIDVSMAGNNELGTAVNDRLKLKGDHSDFNEREAFKKYVSMGRKAKDKTLPNGRKA